MAKTVVAKTDGKKDPGGKDATTKKGAKAPSSTTKTHFEEPPRPSAPKWLAIFPTVSGIMLLWLFALRLDLYSPFYFDANQQAPIAIVIALDVLFLILLGIAFSSRARHDEERIDELAKTYVAPEERVGASKEGGEVDGEELVEVEPEVVEDEDMQAAPPLKSKHEALIHDQGVIDYPPQITGGIYSDTLVPVGRGTILKLRTIIARSCILCDKKVECWPRSRRTITKEDFMANTECKGGLRRLGVKDI